MSAHTPGPWTVQRYSREVAVEAPCGRVLYCQSRGCDEQVEADAMLIAAAPELADALRAFNAIDEFKGWHPNYHDAIAKARAALAKAGAA